MRKPLACLWVLLCAGYAGLAAAAGSAGGACAPDAPWEKWRANASVSSVASLQRGARNYMNYCLGCHSLQYMRYSRLAADLGMSEQQVMENLMFTGGGIHDYIKSAMPADDAAEWFGLAPPDLTLITRARGADYVYQFLKGFYADGSRPTGANNLVLKDTAMPYVLAGVGGERKAVFTLEKCVENGEEKMVRQFDGFETVTPGQLNEEEYDRFVRDTVNFLQYAGEPAQASRQSLGVWVILFLIVFTLFAWMLNKEIWKDVH
jgi:ubiquinol-cytochrome c reductase cytochrome c1 subunit